MKTKLTNPKRANLMKILQANFICIVFTFLTINIFGQTFDYSQSSNLYDVMQTYNNSYAASLPDSLKGAVNKEMERTFKMWAPRLAPSGDFRVAASAMYNYFNAFTINQLSSSCASDYENVVWEELGPDGLPDGSPSNGVGRIQRVYHDPNYDGISNKILYASSEVSGLWKSLDDGINWDQLNTDYQLPISSVSAVSIDNVNTANLFIATGMADVQLNSNIESNSYILNPIWTAGVYRSMDSGQNWEPVNAGLLNAFNNGGSIRNMKIHPTLSNRLYVATSEGFFRTFNALDAAPTWSNSSTGLNNDNQLRGLEFKPNNPSIMYISGKDIYISTNGGTNWVSMTGFETGLDLNALPDNFEVDRINLAVTPANPNAVFAYIIGSYDYYSTVTTQWYRFPRAYIYKFDGGEWFELDEFSTAISQGTSDGVPFAKPSAYSMLTFAWLGITVSPVDEHFIVYGYTGLRAKRGASSNFSQFVGYNPSGEFHADVHDVKFVPSGTNPKLFAGTHGGVSEGVMINEFNLMADWQLRCEGLRTSTIWTFDISKTEGEAIIIGTQDNGSTYIEDGMTNWEQLAGGDGYRNSIAPPHNPRVYYDPNIKSRAILPLAGNTTPVPYPLHTFYNWEDMLTKSFSTIYSVKTGSSYFSYTELYQLIRPENPSGLWSEVWQAASDICLTPIFNNPGETGNKLWRHQISEVANNQTTPDVVYLAVGGFDMGVGNDPFVKPALLKSESGFTDGIFDTNNPKFFDLTPNLPTISSSDLVVPCISGLAVDPGNADNVWITFTGYYADKKVWKSTDGGETWINDDPTGSLANLPVNGIIIQDGTKVGDSDHRIFIATDAGVYYKEPGSDCWSKYGLIPNVRVTELAVRSCENKLYAATWGRGVWKTDMPQPTTSLSSVLIEENTVWETPRFLEQDITVKAGNTLTVKDVIYMPKDGKIVVEQNARLIVDGGTITNSCGELWRGIEVWGNTTQHQYSYGGGQYYQGRAIFKNGAVIENAIKGVSNEKSGDGNTRGGIIQASSNTKFLNCRRAAEFKEYQNFQPGSNPPMDRPEQSRFIKTTFEINDDYPGDLDLNPVLPRITMWRTDRLSILGCTFINSSTVSSSENRRVAVYSHDANYIVNDYCPTAVPWGETCPNPVRTTFTGWHKGVEALETASGRPIRVGNSIFTENMIGVELNAVDFSEIYKNYFYVGGHPFETFPNAEVADQNHLGIYSNATHHFAIEQNEFIQPLQNTPNDPPFDAHGVLINNSLGAENQVYNNGFSRLKTGVNGWRINRNTESEGGVPEGYAGLQYLCNTNNDNEVDFEISRSGTQGSDEYDLAGIRYRQGGKFQSAENTFSPASSNPLIFTHWTIDSEPAYRYYSTQAIAPNPNEIGPDEMNLYNVSSANSCPLNYTTGGLTGKTALLAIKAEYEGIYYAYHQLIDNGNTPATVTAIELTWPQQAWQMRDELMLRAPYNSETVLIAAIDRNIMPHAMLLEVLLANPDALRNGNVIRHAETIPSPPLPEYMIDLLWASRDQSTLRTEMESTLADLHMEVQRLQKIIISNKAFSTDIEPDSTIYYLSQVKTVEGNYSRASAYANRNQYSQAISLLDSMQLSYKLSAERSTEMTALKTLYGTLSNAHQAGQTIANLDSTYIHGLITIAENNTAAIAAQKAQNALCFHYSICYDAQGQPKNDAVLRKPKPVYDELIAKLNTSLAYPNPTDQFVTITYSFLHAKDETTLIVLDNLGRQVEMRNLGEVYEGQQLIDTRKLPNGMYLFKISQEGKKVSEGKFIVTH